MKRYEFTPAFGNRPSQLVGREDVVRELLEGFDAPPGAKSRSMVVLGQRGFGKTVLLWELADRARAKGFAVATPTSVREGLVGRVVEKLQEDGIRALGNRQTNVSGVGLGVLGLSVNLSFTKDDQQKSDEFRLTSLCRRLSGSGLGALILIDELRANDAEVRRLVGTYQELVGEGLDVAIVLAGLPGSVSGTLNDHVLTFLNRARKLELGPLATGDIDAFYRKAFRSCGLDVDRAIRRRAVLATQGSPYLMQLLGHYLVLQAEEDGVVGEEAYAEALEDALEEYKSDICGTTLAALSDKDRAYLHTMADIGLPCRTAEVAAKMGVSADYGQQYRRRLLDGGIIRAPRSGYVDFAVPYLADYMRSEQ